jgi:hypothetical protein
MRNRMGRAGSTTISARNLIQTSESRQGSATRAAGTRRLSGRDFGRAGTVLEKVTAAVRKVLSPGLVPEWLPEIPAPASRQLPRTDHATAAAVYYVACANRIFAGPQREAPPGGQRRDVKRGGAAGVDSAGHGRFLLRGHPALQGIRRGQHGDGQPHRREGLSVPDTGQRPQARRSQGPRLDRLGRD